MNRSFFSPGLSLLLFLTLCACGPSVGQSSPPPPPPPQEKPTPPVVTESGAKCGQVDLAVRPLRYCFEDRAGQAMKSNPQVPVIYYFHGLGGSVEDIFEGANRFILDALHRSYGDQMPIVVSLSLGNEGVLGDDTGSVGSSGLAAIEGFIAPGKSLRRTVMGGSMGGHNSLRLVAQNPNQYAAVVSVCPAMATFNGHHRNEVDAYIARHEPLLDRDFFERALASYQRQLPTPEIWEANNPFTFLSQGAYDQLPIFLSTGIEDQLGFIEGTREFNTRAQARGIKVDYHEVHGPHCTFAVSPFLRFMKTHTHLSN